MRALGIIGSPRKESISTRLLQAALGEFNKSGWEVETFDATRDDISPCPACGACAKTGKCVRHDALDRCFDLLDRADAVIVATPVYFYSISSQLKRLIDRSQPYWYRRFRMEDKSLTERPLRPAAWIATAGGPQTPRLFTGVELPLQVWANTMGLRFDGNCTLTETDGIDAGRLAEAEDESRKLAKALMAEEADN